MSIKIGLCQMSVKISLSDNLQTAERMISKASHEGAQIVVLPEMFQTPYENSYFIENVEGKGTTYNFLSQMAKKYGVLLVGGSFPYGTKDCIKNTCFIFDCNGKEIGMHSKFHLFDIDVPGGVKFKESDTLTAGNQVTVVDTNFGKIGVAICYDMRFPELYRAMAMLGAKIIITPAAFNMTTGPAHWDILAKGRALDNQVYNVLCSPARDESQHYVAYGHSLVVSPWGQVVGELGNSEDILIVDMDLDKVTEARTSIPTYEHLKWHSYPNTFDYAMKKHLDNLYLINAANRYLKGDCWMETILGSHVIRNDHWTLPLFDDEETLEYFLAERTDNYIGFPGVRESLFESIKNRLTVVWENPCSLYHYDGEKYIIEDNPDIGPLTMKDFHIVHDHYTYQSDISKAYIKNIIENNKTLCLRIDGKPVSWIVEHMDGSLGIMFTLKEHRKKGYGELLSKHMVNWYIKNNKIPYIHIERTNEPSIRLAERLGFKYFDTVYWFGAVKEKNVSKN